MTNSNEFPVPVGVVKVGHEPLRVSFEADERQRTALAARFGILSVDSLRGEATLHRESDGMTIAVAGRFAADVTQACVSTLEPVPDHIEEDFEGWFLDESQATSFVRAKKRRAEREDDDIFDTEAEDHIADERDDPEPVVGGTIDVGELVAQYLSLALDPYPHCDAALASGPLGEDVDMQKANPFDVLKDLKTK